MGQVGAKCAFPNAAFPRQHQDLVFHGLHFFFDFLYGCKESKSGDQAPDSVFQFLNFYCSRVDLQCYVSFCCKVSQLYDLIVSWLSRYLILVNWEEKFLFLITKVIILSYKKIGNTEKHKEENEKYVTPPSGDNQT